jgi:hypothetical protein
MTTDVTALLIQRILSTLSPADASAQNFSASILSQANDVISNAASYAQILGTAEGPIAQAAAVSEVANIAATEGATAATEATAVVGVETAGVGAAVVLFISFFLALISGSSDSGSTESEQLAQLANEVQNLEDTELANYWQDKFTSINGFWNSPTGGLGTDLDNLANEGTGGIDVKNDVSKFHDHALAFVNNFLPSKNPFATIYWERPVVQSQLFSSQQVVYPSPDAPVDPDTGVPYYAASIMGWYGNPQPQPQAGPPLGGSGQQMALDPRSMLPYLLLGIRSYLIIESLVNIIDPTQPTLSAFLAQFGGDLQGYASFIYSQYQLAVNGILKSDLPSDEDVKSFFWFQVQVVYQSSIPNETTEGWGSRYYMGTTASWAFRGFEWNGVYGAVDQYPPYGAYQSSPPVPIPSSSPSCLIDLIGTDKLVAEVAFEFSYEYLQSPTLGDWILPWVQDRLILGRMARWKALYLINGYDKVWSILQNLQALTNQSPLPTMNLDQDGTIADGNWSARELCTVLDVDGDILDGIETPDGDLTTTWWMGGYPAGTPVGGYSLFALVAALDNIARGDWGGSPVSESKPRASWGSPPSRPLGFRDRLAAAAV